MAGRSERLSDEAREWDDLIRDVHQHEQGLPPVETSSTDAPTPIGSPSDERAHQAHLSRFGDALRRIIKAPGGQVLWALIVLLMVLVGLVAFNLFDGDDGSTSDSDAGSTPAAAGPAEGQASDGAEDPVAPDSVSSDAGVATPAVSAENAEPAAQPPTHAELAAQDPIPLTEGTWRFFADSTEDHALYDIAFEPTGRFYEDDAEHNEGAYEVSGSTIEMTLVRVATVSASDGVNERAEEAAWNEWFTMTRTGNTLTGTWTQEAWVFSYDDGFVLKGIGEPAEGIFARPQRSDDRG